MQHAASLRGECLGDVALTQAWRAHDGSSLVRGLETAREPVVYRVRAAAQGLQSMALAAHGRSANRRRRPTDFNLCFIHFT